MTPPYAEVIGDPITQSRSPTIHNFWLAKLGIEAEYRAVELGAADLPAYFAARRADPAWRGCNVTMPLKQAVMPLVDQIDDFAARAGAINTIIRHDRQLVGANSDGAGFLEPLEGLEVGHAAIIGTGGAARAIVLALLGAGFIVELHGRTADRARELADEIAPGAPIASLGLGDPFFGGVAAYLPRLLVNASSLGMVGHPPLPISLVGLDASLAVYDIVTGPVETALLRQAKASGMRRFDGLQMLVGQAAVAFERLFDHSAPREHDAELRQLLCA